MSKHQLETLDGGVPHLRVQGKVTEADTDLFSMLAQISRKAPQLLLNLAEVTETEDIFIDRIREISALTRIKVVTALPLVTRALRDGSVLLFPTEKSACLAIVGEEALRVILVKMNEAPVLASDACSLVNFMSTPEATFENVIKRVEKIPNLCGQIVKVANSAMFYRGAKVETVQQAVSRLGLVNLAQIFVYNFYSGVSSFFGNQQQIITHCQKCATLAFFIAQSGKLPADECGKIWLGALMHDIGKQALSFVFSQKYEEVLRLMKEEGHSSVLAELNVFGTEHPLVGSLLAQKWNFPEYLVNVIGDHHSLAAKQWNLLTLPVYCANSFMNELEGFPFAPYFQRLEGYFFLLKRDVPWPNVIDVFHEVVEKDFNPLG